MQLRFIPQMFRHIQLALNFCLPAAAQLSHTKGMCLNGALNQNAFKQIQLKKL